MTLTHILPLNPPTEGYLDPYYSPSSYRAKDSASSTTSSNKSSRSSSKSAKKPVTQPVIIHHDADAPKDPDSYDKRTDARHYKNSYLDSGEPKNKDSMKANDSRYYPNSSYYKD